MERGRRFRILSLDGGGVWGLVEAHALARIFGPTTPGRQVLGEFDLIAGNSAGSLVLASLMADRTPAEVLSLFTSAESRSELFVPASIFTPVNPVAQLIGPRWSTAKLMDGLRARLGDTGALTLDRLPALIGGRRPQVLLISFDYDRQRAVFFRSNGASLAANSTPSAPPSLVLAAAASADAPVRYFDRPVLIPDPPNADRRYWDGGVGGYNNPVLAAVVEALANGVPASSISVLSLGTGAVMRPLADATIGPPLAMPDATPGTFHDLVKLTGAILDEPPDAASFIAHVALGQRLPAGPRDVVTDGSLIRMAPVARPLRDAAGWRLPASPTIKEAQFARITELDSDAVAQADVTLIDDLAREWLEDIWPNQAIRADRDFNCEIGQPTFSAARAAWEAARGA